MTTPENGQAEHGKEPRRFASIATLIGAAQSMIGVKLDSNELQRIINLAAKDFPGVHYIQVRQARGSDALMFEIQSSFPPGVAPAETQKEMRHKICDAVEEALIDKRLSVSRSVRRF